jgi:hypothetical protein
MCVIQIAQRQHLVRILQGEDPEIWPKVMTINGQYQI